MACGADKVANKQSGAFVIGKFDIVTQRGGFEKIMKQLKLACNDLKKNSPEQ